MILCFPMSGWFTDKLSTVEYHHRWPIVSIGQSRDANEFRGQLWLPCEPVILVPLPKNFEINVKISNILDCKHARVHKHTRTPTVCFDFHHQFTDVSLQTSINLGFLSNCCIRFRQLYSFHGHELNFVCTLRLNVYTSLFLFSQQFVCCI